jgi:hypothetical protein
MNNFCFLKADFFEKSRLGEYHFTFHLAKNINSDFGSNNKVDFQKKAIIIWDWLM